MTTPTGSPDWVKPLPGGARVLIDQNVNLFSAGGIYTSPFVGVTPYSGLFVQWQNLGLAASFQQVKFIFIDQPGFVVIQPTWVAASRGDLPGAVNVPVLGAQMQVEIIGPQDNVNGHVTVTGHGGGPGANVALASGVLASLAPGALAAGASATTTASTVTEGAAIVAVGAASQPGTAVIIAASGTGATTIIAEKSIAANTNDTFRVWLPPGPITLRIDNTGAAAGQYNIALTKERS